MGTSGTLVTKDSSEEQGHGRPWAPGIRDIMVELLQRDAAIRLHRFVDDCGPN
jgi:hypothetical protein